MDQLGIQVNKLKVALLWLQELHRARWKFQEEILQALGQQENSQ